MIRLLTVAAKSGNAAARFGGAHRSGTRFEFANGFRVHFARRTSVYG